MAQVGEKKKDKAKAPKNPASAEANGETAPRRGPSFEMREVPAGALATIEEDGVERQVPAPNPARTRVVSRNELNDNLVALQQTPDKWVEVVFYSARNGTEERPGGARKVVTQFMDGKVAAPVGEGSYDLEWRDAGYDGGDRRGSVVIAMFIPVESE